MMSFIQDLVNQRNKAIEQVWQEFFNTAINEAQKLIGKRVNLNDKVLNFQSTTVIREIIAPDTHGHVFRIKDSDGIICCIQETTEIIEAND